MIRSFGDRRTEDLFHCIRVNDQWRLVLRWEAGGVVEVRLTDSY